MNDLPDVAGSPRTRWRVALVFAAAAGAYAAARAMHEPHWPTDFDQLWHAARALAGGRDPYAVVGPGREFQWNWPLYYPISAVLLALPFAALPVAVARVAFTTVSGGLLGWAIGSRVRHLWPLLLSASWLIACSRTQWSLLLLAAAFAPVLGMALSAKPNVGLAAVAGQSRRGAIVALVGMVVITLAGTLVRPDWIAHWREAIRDAPHVTSPILLPGGFLLALAAFRWRRPDARLLLALACIPHTPSLYDLLLLFFVCRTLREALLLATLTHVLFWGFVTFGSGPVFEAYALGLGKAAIFIVYLPALVVVLIRPNVFSDVGTPAPLPAGWRAYVPATRPQLALLAGLVIGATMLVWLPLVTYR